MPPIRLLLVDDHTLMRRGLVALLRAHADLQVVGEAADAGEAMRHAEALQPDVILLDNHLPGVRGVDALAGLHQVAPQAKVLMLTVSEDEDDLREALQRGAQGYLLKTIEGEALADAVRRAVAGESTISPEMTGKLVTAFRTLQAGDAEAATSAADPIDTLSPREQEILQHVGRGLSNKEIARALGIAETTVKVHVQHILRKLGLSSRVQAAVAVAGRG